MVSHSARESKCKSINTDNTGRCQTLKQRNSYNCIHSSSNGDPAVGRKMKTI